MHQLSHIMKISVRLSQYPTFHEFGEEDQTSQCSNNDNHECLAMFHPPPQLAPLDFMSLYRTKICSHLTLLWWMTRQLITSTYRASCTHWLLVRCLRSFKHPSSICAIRIPKWQDFYIPVYRQETGLNILTANFCEGSSPRSLISVPFPKILRSNIPLAMHWTPSGDADDALPLPLDELYQNDKSTIL